MAAAASPGTSPTGNAADKDKTLAAFRKRLETEGPVQGRGVRGRLGLLPPGPADTGSGADALLASLRRAEPAKLAHLGDTDTVDSMVGVLTVNDSVVHLTAHRTAGLAGAKAQVSTLWSACKDQGDRANVHSIHAWRKMHGLPLTKAHRLALEMFMRDDERAEQYAGERRERMQHWISLLGTDPEGAPLQPLAEHSEGK